jgi:hypothetical protein
MLAEEYDRLGAFIAIKGLVDDGSISNENAAAQTKAIFAFYQKRVDEAKSEVRHLSTVLSRLEMVCRAGPKYRPGSSWLTTLPQIQALSREATTFDNWTMSLYETNLTMLGLAVPDIARRKPLEMASSMEELRKKRLAALSFSLKDPSLFRIG